MYLSLLSKVYILFDYAFKNLIILYKNFKRPYNTVFFSVKYIVETNFVLIISTHQT